MSSLAYKKLLVIPQKRHHHKRGFTAEDSNIFFNTPIHLCIYRLIKICTQRTEDRTTKRKVYAPVQSCPVGP